MTLHLPHYVMKDKGMDSKLQLFFLETSLACGGLQILSQDFSDWEGEKRSH
jgi:hypothetical protein